MGGIRLACLAARCAERAKLGQLTSIDDGSRRRSAIGRQAECAHAELKSIATFRGSE
jgi:hypothetical protein